MAEGLGADLLARAHRHCAEVTRRSGSSFAAAFWLLDRPQRHAIHAVYAFCRLADDIADDPAVRGDRTLLLARWRDELDAAYAGRAEHLVGVALAEAVQRYALPRELFLELLAGIESDLHGESMERFEDLRRYCFRVASTVGLVIVRVLGVTRPSALVYAEQMGIAVQLTNVLRDVAEDAAGGRVYLAREDLIRFGVEPADLVRTPRSEPERSEGGHRARGEWSESVRLLLACYAERARLHYERAEAALDPEDRRALRPAEAMGRIYRHLLETVHREGFPCLGGPRRLSKPRRIAIAAGAWLGLGATA
jgi:15-cis-phytoene synthase